MNPEAQTSAAELDAWGRSILEEVLLRAGLRSSDPSVLLQRAEASLDFEITADAATGELEVRCNRIGGPPLCFRVPLRDG